MYDAPRASTTLNEIADISVADLTAHRRVTAKSITSLRIFTVKVDLG